MRPRRLRIPRVRVPRARFGPSPTIRLRLTVLYGLVFLVTGAVLLTIGYILVRDNISGHHAYRAALFHQYGLATPRPPVGFANSPGAKFAHEIQAQIANDALHRLVVEYLFALGVMTMIAVGTGWLLAGRALRPLREITATARRVSGENLGERIALSAPADELKELADTIDGMLGRLDAAFASQRHFVANASHELRTPLRGRRGACRSGGRRRGAAGDGGGGPGDRRSLRATDREPACARAERGGGGARRGG
jgi:signal transduction histidine kinase